MHVSQPSIIGVLSALVGVVRLVAAIEALNGLLLLAWSGAFLYSVLSRDAAA